MLKSNFLQEFLLHKQTNRPPNFLAESKPLLRVTNLRLDTESGNSLVRGLEFEISSGESVGFVGPSGSGKSLTAAALFGLLPPTVAQSSGSMTWLPGTEDALELSSLNESAWGSVRGSAIGWVFEDPLLAFNPLLPMGTQVAEALRVDQPELSEELIATKVLGLLKECGLPDPENVIHAYPHQLSGGMLQRAMLAAALAGSPRLLIADEATTALDLPVQAKVLELVA
ncbi:MAG: ATP-binding cassette domain-containing protein, partial [Planctomycetes bacterium]|nr:ATP-binding cassette domain-containing protein [Planctomycetota bacterium]